MKRSTLTNAVQAALGIHPDVPPGGMAAYSCHQDHDFWPDPATVQQLADELAWAGLMRMRRYTVGGLPVSRPPHVTLEDLQAEYPGTPIAEGWSEDAVRRGQALEQLRRNDTNWAHKFWAEQARG